MDQYEIVAINTETAERETRSAADLVSASVIAQKMRAADRSVFVEAADRGFIGVAAYKGDAESGAESGPYTRGSLVRVDQTLGPRELYGSQTYDHEIVIRRGEIGRVCSEIRESAGGPWIAVRFFYNLPDHYRRDHTCEPVHYLKLSILSPVSEAEAVIEIMRIRYGKPWRNEDRDQSAIVEYRRTGDPAVLGNWRHAAGTISAVIERVETGAKGEIAAGETDLTVYKEAETRIDGDGLIVSVDGLIVSDPVGGGPFVCTGCGKLIKYLTISGRPLCGECI